MKSTKKETKVERRGVKRKKVRKRTKTQRKRGKKGDPTAASLFANNAGLFISGDSGGGKSEFMRRINRAAVEAGAASVIELDPHGDNARDNVADNLEAGHGDRTMLLAPGDTALPIATFNPLRVARHEGQSDYDYQAALACKADAVAHVIPTVFGANDFDGAPRMFTNTSAITRTLARMELPLTEYEHFFEDSPLHEEFLQCIPDPVVRRHFELIGEMRAAERDQILASTKMRFDALVNGNPIVKAHLGDSHKCLSIGHVIDNRLCVYWDLSGQGRLSEKQRSLLANLLLTEIFFEVLSRPKHLRRPLVLIIDELPVVVQGCKDLLRFVLPQTRKYLLRFVGATQGTQRWVDGTNDGLLHTLVSTCSLAVFRHRDPVDAEFFGKIVGLPQLNPTQEKFRYEESQQYQDGIEIITLVNRSIQNTWSQAEQEGGGGGEHQDENQSVTEGTTKTGTKGLRESETISDGESSGDSQSENWRDAVDSARGLANGQSRSTSKSTAKQTGTHTSESNAQKIDHGRGTSAGWNQTWNWTRQRTSGGGSTTSITQQVLPIMRWRNVLKFIEFVSLDDQIKMFASQITALRTGACFLFPSEGLPIKVYVPMLKSRFKNLPGRKRELLIGHLIQQAAIEVLQDPQLVLAKREEFLQITMEEFWKLRGQRPIATPEERPRLDRPNFGNDELPPELGL